MDIKEFAKLLDGRLEGSEITTKEEAKAKELGFVVVFGASDDLMELRGAIDDEAGCYDGGLISIDSDGVVKDECGCKYAQEALHNSTKIEACWWNDGDYTWTYETKIPHEKFDVLDEEGNKWCEGIVFRLEDIN